MKKHIKLYLYYKQNYAKFLNEALVALKYNHKIEIVIIDDHSSDKSAEIIKDFKKIKM